MNRSLHVVARGFALAVGVTSLFNSLAATAGRFDANLWWLDLRPLPHPLVLMFCIVVGATLITFGVRRRVGRGGRMFTALVCASLLTLSIRNVIQFFCLDFRGAIQAGVCVPVSLLVVMGLIGVLVVNRDSRESRRRSGGRFGSVAFAAFLFAIFPLVQMVCFGFTDYRRRADVAVVFGARAHQDGHASQALSDRVLTACRLYRDGYVRKLIFSGGPGDGDVHETQAMRALALNSGVADADILLDPSGLNTAATTRNTINLFTEHGFHRVLAVSHFYHLPRVKLSYQQAGFDVYTVPARGDRTLGGLGWFMTREVAADWVYYARGLLGTSI